VTVCLGARTVKLSGEVVEGDSSLNATWSVESVIVCFLSFFFLFFFKLHWMSSKAGGLKVNKPQGDHALASKLIYRSPLEFI